MRIQLNGKAREVRDGLTAAELLAELGLDGRVIVVEVNRRILRGAEVAETRLGSGDRVELVHFVGGG